MSASMKRNPYRWVVRSLAGTLLGALVLGQQCASSPQPDPVPGSGQPRVTIQTNKGLIILELFDRQAPQTVASFLAFVDEGTYDSTIIHEVQPNTYIAGGLYTQAEQPALLDQPPAIPNESSNGLLNLRGRVVAVKVEDSNYGNSGFRILLSDQPGDDYDPETKTPGTTVFGKVVDGMEVADEIGASETESIRAEDLSVLNAVPTPRVLVGQIVEGEQDLPPADPCEGVECPDGQMCDNGECIDPCEGVECPDGQICVNGECVDDPCEGVECPDGQVCANGECVDPCDGVECPDGQVCVDGVCVDPCDGVECPDGQICVNGECVDDPCESLECPDGQVCVNGECVEQLGADAGDDRVAAAGLMVTLDGNGSDAGVSGGTLSFAWTQTDGPDVELSNATSATPQFTVPEGAESLTFELMISNEEGGTGTDSVTITVAADPHVRLDTSMGNILLSMLVDDAPISTNNFMQYVVDGFYDATIFHRVPENFVIQGGGFLPGLIAQEPLRDPIVNEFSPDRPNVRGTLAMAKTSDPDSATSQFFINTKDNPSLDNTSNSGGFTVFGEVVEGLDVVDEIQAVETGSQQDPDGNTFNDVPVDDVLILTATIEEAPSEFTTTESGLQYSDVVVGDGAVVQPDSTIRVLYEGRLDDENGEVFDSSSDPENPAQFGLTGLIAGWQEGLGEIEMREGGTRQLIIPPDLGYGEQGQGNIPPNATLWFEIEVIEVVE
jgi:cyclophilin family peptidyl-prolyl cis-trans isomerase